MITLDRAKRLIDSDLSLITVADNKVPLGSWKKFQTEPMTKEEFEKVYDQGNHIGICTGYSGIECIDVDLKVFSSLADQQAFWNELIAFLKDNIDDFDEKFVIYKTQNQGYHIIYRCSEIVGNKKIARLKGHTECVIESRGLGGYIFVYENQVSKNSYTDIKEISQYDREILWGICAYYNYQTEEIKPEPKEVSEYDNANIKPWEEYNQKTSIFDIIGTDFKIVRTLSDKYIIKRHGANSPHSGYVYKDSGCMYLFSTATIYPNEKLITPFIAYTYKNHNGNFKASGSAIYREGYGTRIVKKVTELPELKVNVADLTFPIDIFPADLQNYILQCQDTLDSSVDYMGCSLIWLASTVVGNSMSVHVKNGWSEIATVWIAIVGKAGLGKTPSVKNITFPLENANNREVKIYERNKDKYESYKELDKKEKENYEEVQKPVKKQFLVDDITLEALVDLHQESKNSVAVFKDELKGWINDMNKYRVGSDLEFWLSTWSGKSVNLNRISRRSSFVSKPLIPVLGGIQPTVLNNISTSENKDNGFLDRLLLSFPELEVEHYNERELPLELLQWYNDAIIYFYNDVKDNIVKHDEWGDVITLPVKMSPDAKTEWIRVFNEITDLQNSDEENEYMKSMLPKQKSYIPRFALLINTLSCYFNGGESLTLISKDSLLKAEKLSKYFIAMAKKVKSNSLEVSAIKETINLSKTKSTKEVFLEMYKNNPKVNKKEAAELLGVSRKTIYEYLKENV